MLSLIGVEQPQLNLLYRKQENSYTPNLSLKCMLDYTTSSLWLYIIISFSTLFLNTFLMLLFSFFSFSSKYFEASEDWLLYLTRWNFYSRLCTVYVWATGHLGVLGGVQAARVAAEGALQQHPPHNLVQWIVSTKLLPGFSGENGCKNITK